MTRVKVYQPSNVLEAARARVSRVVDEFDRPVVSFSGGKDSLVVLHLFLQEYQRRGLGPLDAVFLDEEVIPDTVINFVEGYRSRGDLRLTWAVVPQDAQEYVLGRVNQFTMWDPARAGRWVRDKPASYWEGPDPTRVWDFPTEAPELFAQVYPGEALAVCTGVRAAESLVRWRVCVSKLGPDSWIHPSAHPNAKTAKPIYDWQENDVFKYLHDHGITYCPIYDHQMWAGHHYRVAPALTPEMAKSFEIWRALDPGFYDRLAQAFPESTTNRYFHDMDRTVPESVTYLDCWRYIRENIPAGHHKDVMRGMRSAMSVVDHHPQGHKAFPPRHLMKWLMGGTWWNQPTALTYWSDDDDS